MKGIAPSLEDTVSRCDFSYNYTLGCGDLFQTTITEEDVCYSFNAMNSRDIYTNE